MTIPLLLAGCSGGLTHTGGTRCPEAPCVVDLASAVADEPGRADWGGQRLQVWDDLVFVSAPGNGAAVPDPAHLSVFRLPDLRYEGQWNGEDTNDMTAVAVDVTDLEGDGVPEILVGRPNDDFGADTTGTVHLVSGVPSGPVHVRDAALFTFSSPQEVRVGSGVVFADVDLDGRDDLVLSGFGLCCPDASSIPGALYAFDAALRGDVSPDQASITVPGSTYGRWNELLLHDVDDDGQRELVEHDGVLAAWRLPLGPEDPVADWRGGSGQGLRASALGDVTGDGIADLAAHDRDLPDENRAGRLFIVPGGSASGGPIDAMTTQVHGGPVGDAMGFSAASADVDGDGALDLVVGASGVYPGVERPGRVLVFKGPSAAS